MGDSLSWCCCGGPWFDILRWHFVNDTPGIVPLYYGPDITETSSPNDLYLVSPTASGSNATGQTANSLSESVWSIDMASLTDWMQDGSNAEFNGVTGEGYVAGVGLSPFTLNTYPPERADYSELSTKDYAAWVASPDGTGLKYGLAFHDGTFTQILSALDNINYHYYFGLIDGTFPNLVDRYNWESNAASLQTGGTLERGLYIASSIPGVKGVGDSKLSFGGGSLITYERRKGVGSSIGNGQLLLRVHKITDQETDADYDLLQHSVVGSFTSQKAVSTVVQQGFYGPNGPDDGVNIVFLRHRLNKTCISIESIYTCEVNTYPANEGAFYDAPVTIAENCTHKKNVCVGMQILGEFTSQQNIPVFEVLQDDPQDVGGYFPPHEGVPPGGRLYESELHLLNDVITGVPFQTPREHRDLDDLYDVDVRLFDASESPDGNSVNAFGLLTYAGLYYGGASITPSLIYDDDRCFKEYHTVNSGSSFAKTHSYSWHAAYLGIRQWCIDNSHPLTGWDSNPPPSSAWSAINAEEATTYDTAGTGNTPWLEGAIYGFVCPPVDSSDTNAADLIVMFGEMQIRNANYDVTHTGANAYYRVRLEFWRNGSKFAIAYSDLISVDPSPTLLSSGLQDKTRFLCKTKRFTYVKMPLPNTTSGRVAIRNDASGYFECKAKQTPTSGAGDLLDISFSNYDQAPPTSAANLSLTSYTP